MFASHHSGLTVLCYLVSHVLKTLFYIWYLTFQLFGARRQTQLLSHHFTWEQKSLHCILISKSKAFLIFVSLYVINFKGSFPLFMCWNLRKFQGVVLSHGSRFIHSTWFLVGPLSPKIHNFNLGENCEERRGVLLK